VPSRSQKSVHTKNTHAYIDMYMYLEHLECSLQPSPPGCFTIKLSEARSNGIGVFAAGEAALPKA
jgi:hypothetical protein